MLTESGWVGVGPGNDDEDTRARLSSREEATMSELSGTT